MDEGGARCNHERKNESKAKNARGMMSEDEGPSDSRICGGGVVRLMARFPFPFLFSVAVVLLPRGRRYQTAKLAEFEAQDTAVVKWDLSRLRLWFLRRKFLNILRLGHWK